MSIDVAFRTSVEHHRAGRFADAERGYRTVLAQQPQHADALHMLGLLAHQAGRGADAIDLIGRAIAARPTQAEFHGNLGAILLSQGKIDEGIASMRQLCTLRPDFSEGHNNLGVVLMNAGRFDEAAEAFRQSVKINPSNAEAQYNLGIALGTANDWPAAAEALRAALKLQPDRPGTRETLGHALSCGWRPDEAAAIFREAMTKFGESPENRVALGNALFDAGLAHDALPELRRALQLRPNDAKIHSNYLFVLQYQPDLDPAAILKEHRAWDERHAKPLLKERKPHQIDHNPNRRLRIGYISSDFREHAAARFIVPLFAHHDRNAFEITCYSQVPRPDAITQRIMSMVDRWRDIAPFPDDMLADMIRNDRIDILVDLSMHMAGSRLLALAREPAPVQMAWLAYPGTTGMSTMHYRISDPYLDPPEFDDRYTEQTLRLPHTYWCYDPLSDVGSDVPVNDLPAIANGHITLGCLNNFCKVNAPTVSRWAKVLQALPDARMIMMAPPGGPRQRVIDQLTREGVAGAADRLEFVAFQPREQYLRTYHRIDFCLDTLPYNGHTTSFDSFWMGVPVITRVGTTLVGRAGLGQLSNLELKDLIAQTDEDFVRIATSLANDIPRLSDLRKRLRDRMQHSPLMDGQRFARDMEAIYREVWRRRVDDRTR